MKFKKICRFSFNTGFIPFGSVMVLTKPEIDPCKFKNSKKVSDSFAINMIFQDLCPCTSDMELSDRCQYCKSTLDPQETEKWEKIKQILEERVEGDGNVLLFGNSTLDDIDAVLNQTDPSRIVVPEYQFLN